ncbi:hypothetical protein FGG08_007627 [Glutinoglossum americanum]|uniref:Uncharacterized protein n=1 Tax=Glutinoglossum americanum TaxID=1670608 RepID=A0A9P8HVW6_9PEZI|nr:hypothetical protein FGG08_007627 [Glutinoglossum americanum]
MPQSSTYPSSNSSGQPSPANQPADSAGKIYSPKAKANIMASSPKVLKMKKQVKDKFVVTDAQLDQLAGILCDLFHEEALQAQISKKKDSRELLTALLA